MTNRHHRRQPQPLTAIVTDLDAIDAIDHVLDILDERGTDARSDIDTNRARIDKLLADLSDHFHRLGADIAELDQRIQTLEAGDDG